ncbi:MAG TPA: tetratricopeptide repeat protein, partial [Gemmataceae bacterium]|nr:tetratricopeptide repeat protein [Gemmataceae bacterium]
SVLAPARRVAGGTNVMASTSAPTGPFRVPPRPPLRQLWQVPTFLLGLVAFAAVCAACPPWRLHRTDRANPALSELRDLLAQPDFDRDHALKLGAEAVHRANTPAASSEARFLLGSVYVALAERAGPGKGQDQWREARANLERAAAGPAEDDRPRLDYRLAKARAQTGEAPAVVIAALAPAIEAGADDPADAARGYGLLAEVYLKLPKPDLAAALAATEKQIALPVVSPELAPARLRRGELLVRLGRADEADEVLKNVKEPPEVAARARRLRVGLLEQAEKWDDAAGVWRDLLDDSAAPPADRPAVLYHLGLCRRNAGESDEALAAWEECLRADGASEGPAAALGVAELRARGREFEPAVAALGRAVRDVKEPNDWHDALAPLPRAREVFEAVCKASASGGAFETSAKAALLYERLAAPGRAHELRAEALVAAARAAQAKARGAADEEKQRLLGEAQKLLCRAGEEYDTAAKAQADLAEKAERLWSAGNCFAEGYDAPRAAAAFDQFQQIAVRPDLLAAKRFNDRLNEAWYKCGLAYKDAGYPQQANKLFEQAANALESDSPYTYRARCECARAKRVPDGAGGWRWTDEAEAILEKNLGQLRIMVNRDEEAREKTLYDLGDLYFDRSEQRETISKAIDTLEEALRDFPGNPHALFARYELAESYRLRADQRSVSLSQEQLTLEARLEIEKKVSDDREKAITNYAALARALDDKPKRDESDDRMLVYALLTAADVRYLAGGYEAAGDMYEQLARRIKDKKGFEVDYYGALARLVRAYQTALLTYPAGDPRADAAKQKVRQALDEIRAVLPRLDLETRQGFEKWLKAVDPSGR